MSELVNKNKQENTNKFVAMTFGKYVNDIESGKIDVDSFEVMNGIKEVGKDNGCPVRVLDGNVELSIKLKYKQ